MSSLLRRHLANALDGDLETRKRALDGIEKLFLASEDCLVEMISNGVKEIKRLKAENERLRKAGDSVVLCLCADTPEFHKQDCAKAWLAAKEVQS
jgi:hypothetical protein